MWCKGKCLAVGLPHNTAIVYSTNTIYFIYFYKSNFKGGSNYCQGSNNLTELHEFGSESLGFNIKVRFGFGFDIKTKKFGLNKVVVKRRGCGEGVKEIYPPMIFLDSKRSKECISFRNLWFFYFLFLLLECNIYTSISE